MISPLSLLIGLRFSRSRHRSGMVSLVSLISTIGIILGVTVLIICLSAINGFKRELNNRILAVVPHGEIESVNQPWNNWNNAFMKIKKVPGVIAVAPYINFTGLIENGVNLCTILVKGVDPQQEIYLSAIPKFVQNKAWENFRAGKQQIIIGKGVANTLNVNQGDWISIIIFDPSNNHKLQQPKYIRLHIIGIFQLNSQLDHTFAMVPLDDAKQYLSMGNGVNGIAIKINDVFNANKLLYNAGNVIDNYVYIKSWNDTYGYIYHDIQMMRTIIYLVMILIINLACFNIISTVVMAIKEKSKDIAILRTIGAKNSLIYTIFIWYSLLIGLFSTLYGVIIGVIVSIQLTSIISKIEKLIGHQFLSNNVYFIDFLPSEVHWLDIIYVLVLIFLLSLLASWYPAKRANYIDPVKVLSNQ